MLEFDTRSVHSTVPNKKYKWIKEQIYEQDLLLPYPTEGQGYQLTKGSQYLIIAFHLAKTGDDKIVEKLNDLEEGHQSRFRVAEDTRPSRGIYSN